MAVNKNKTRINIFLSHFSAIFLGKHPAVTPKHLENIESVICGAASCGKDDAAAVVNKNVSF